MEEANQTTEQTFRYLVTANLSDSEKGFFVQLHDRVKFRLDAARYFLSGLQELEQKAGRLVGPGIKRRDVEFNLDAFLYEVVGTIDPLLQEINVAFGLSLTLKDVEMGTIIPKLPVNSQVKKMLGKLDGDTEGWFWQLREYRNHSAHRKIIGFDIFAGGDEDGKVYLHKDPLDISKGKADEEVMQYCGNSIKRMENLINEIYKLCISELSSAKP
jgi:hypothetical protein